MTSDSIELMRAGADDAPALACIHLRARAAAGPAFPPPVHADEDLLPHLQRDVLPAAEAWLARIDGEPVGYPVLEGEDLLAALYVDPVAQSRGVGDALLARAKARRPHGLTLWVFTSNTGAQAFSARRGFRVVGGTPGDNEEGVPDLRMRWAPA